MPDEKYVVVKRENFRKTDSPGVFLVEERHVLEDAVVIRTQDVFAAGGLSAYAHSIVAYIELLRTMPFMPQPMPNANNLAEMLQDVADYFMDQSREAEGRLARGECKLPD